MAIAILLLVLGSQILPSECLTVDICSDGVPHINDGRVNISSPGYPNTHEIPPNGLRCSCFVRTTKPNSNDHLEISPIEVSYRGCDGQQHQCDTSCWSSLDFWSTSHEGDRVVCLPRSNFTTNFTLSSTVLTNVTYAANARNSGFTYTGKFLFSISARRAKSLEVSCYSGLTTTGHFSTSIPSTTSTTSRKTRTTRTSTATLSTTRPSTDVSRTESTTSGTPTRSTDSTSTTASSTSSSVDRESSITATTTTTTMMTDKSTVVGETTASTVTDRSTTVSDAATSMATGTVTDTAATSTAPDKSTTGTVRNASTASEATEFTTDTRTGMTSAVSSSGIDTSTGLTDSPSPTTRGTFRGTSADRSTATVVSLDFHSTAVHITSEYPKPSPSETNWYEDSTTAETSTATPVPSRKLIMLAIILAILLLILLLIVIIICCVRKSRRNVKMAYVSGLYTVKMSDLESDVQSPDAQPIMMTMSRGRGGGGGRRSCPLPLHLLLQKTSKKNRTEAAAAADCSKPLCCSYKRQTSDSSYAPMGPTTQGSANSARTTVGPNVYADLDNITDDKQRGRLEHGTTARNPIITITDTDADYYNRPRSASQQSDVHAYETCYSPDGATALGASSEYEHTYAAIQGRKGSIDSLKTESPYSVINEDRLYSNIGGDGQNDETDRDKKRDENQ